MNIRPEERSGLHISAHFGPQPTSTLSVKLFKGDGEWGGDSIYQPGTVAFLPRPAIVERISMGGIVKLEV